MTKSDFIRNHPRIPATDLVALGKKQGMTFTTALVYMVRGPRRKTVRNAASSAKPLPLRDAIAAATQRFVASITDTLREQAIETVRGAL